MTIILLGVGVFVLGIAVGIGCVYLFTDRDFRGLLFSHIQDWIR